MRPNIFKNPTTFAFLVPLIYWAYLFFSTSMGITMDAATYEKLGSMIYSKGWTSYFASGPHKEPLYPFLISFSMNVSDWLSISYQKIQTFFQIICLFAGQLLIYRLFKKMNIHRNITAVLILYMGVSPALVNSTFSLFSEVLTYPLVLGIILVSSNIWLSSQKRSLPAILLASFYLSILFILIISVKSAFLYLFAVYLIPFTIFLLVSFIQKNYRQARKILLFILIISVALMSYVRFIKTINRKYNGSYVYSYQAGFMLYGNTARRVGELTPKQILAAFAVAPGERICRKVFGKENCDFWGFQTSDNLGAKKRSELSRPGLTTVEVNKQLIHLSKNEILSNPVQYFILYIAECFKIFFWESTKIGFVSYPPWLSALFFDFTFFNFSLRLCAAILSFISFFYVIWFLIRNKTGVSKLKPANPEAIVIYSFALFTIISFTGIYSLLCILTRYTFPIVPLHLLNIGLLFQRFVEKN